MSIISASGLRVDHVDGLIKGHTAIARASHGFREDAIDRHRESHNAALFQTFLGTSPVLQAAMQRQDSAAGGINGGLFLARQLDQRIARVLEQPLPQLNALGMFYVSNEVSPGAQTYTVSRVYERGAASIYRGGQRPTPRVTLTQREEQFPVRHVVDGFEWSLFEQASSEFANFSLVDRGTRTANRSIMELINSLAWNGSSADGLYGVLNYPWLDKKVVATTFSASADVDAMMNEIFALIEYPENNSNQAFQPNKVVFSVKLYNFLARTRVKDSTGNGSGTTMLKYIAENNSAGIPLAGFMKANELNDLSSPSGAQGVLVFNDSQDGVKINMVQTVTSLPLQQVGFQNTQYMYASYGGVVMADVGNNILGYVTLEE